MKMRKKKLVPKRVLEPNNNVEFSLCAVNKTRDFHNTGSTHPTVPHLPGPHPPPTAKTGKSFEALQHEQCYLPAAAELQQKGNE